MGEGQAFNGKNWQSWHGAIKQYQQNMATRLKKDKGALNNIKAEWAKDSNDRDFLGAVRDASPELQNFAKTVDYNVQSIEDFNKKTEASIHPLKALGQNLGAIGRSLASMAIQFAAVWAVSAIIGLITSAIDAQVNALKYAKEAAEDLNSAFEDLEKTQKQNTKTVEQYGETWEKLKSGVDEQGNNVSLTDDEYAQYKEAVEQIVSVIPGLASGWNESNEAIKLNVNSVSDLNTELEKTLQKQRALLLAGDDATTFANKVANVNLVNEEKKVNDTEDILTAIRTRDLDKLASFSTDHPNLEGEIANAIVEIETAASGRQELQMRNLETYMGDDDWWSSEAFVDAEQTLASLLTKYTGEITPLLEGYKNMAITWMSTQFSSEESPFKRYSYGFGEELQSAILSFLNSADTDFYASFNNSVETMYSQIGQWFDELSSNAEDMDTLEAFIQAGKDYSESKIGLGRFVESRDALKGMEGLDSTFADFLIPFLENYFGGSIEEATHMRERAEKLIPNVSSAELDSLTSEQIAYLKSLGEDTDVFFASWADFLTHFGKYQTQLETAYDTLSSRWKNIQTAQTTATEVMSATDSNGGVLTRENYDKLVSANKAYAGAVTTFGGVTSIDNDRLNGIMDDQAKELAVKARSGLDQAIEDYRTQQDELMKLRRTGTEDEIAAKEQEIEATKETIMHFELLQQELEYSTSAYAKWKRAQSGSESGDTFREIKSAITDLKEGRKSGRTNTNKYKTAGDLIFGDTTDKNGNQWRAWDTKTFNQRTAAAEKLYDKNGQLNNQEFYRQLLKADMVDKSGVFKSSSIPEIAKALGYSDTFVAQALQAAKEYGENSINFDDDYLSQFIPKTETEANTDATKNLTTSMDELKASVDANTEALGGNVPGGGSDDSDSGGSDTPGKGASTTKDDGDHAPGKMKTVLSNGAGMAQVDLTEPSKPSLFERISGLWKKLFGGNGQGIPEGTPEAEPLAPPEYISNQKGDVTFHAKIDTADAEKEVDQFVGDESSDPNNTVELPAEVAMPTPVPAPAPTSEVAPTPAPPQTQEVNADTTQAENAVMEFKDEAGKPISILTGLDDKAAYAENKRLTEALEKPAVKKVTVVATDGTSAGSTAPVVTTTPAPSSGFAHSSGTRNAPGGNSLVGELGPEIVVSKKTGTWRLASEPQLTKLDKGDMVFNAEETSRILKGGNTPAEGESFATGTFTKYGYTKSGGGRKYFRVAIGNEDAGHNNVISDTTLGKKARTVKTYTYSRIDNSPPTPTGGGGGGGGGSSSKDSTSLADKLSNLYDWIEKALEVAADATQDVIDSVAEKIGAIAKNNTLDKAIAQTGKQIITNQQAYAKYMETANRVQQETGLSADLVTRIQNGAIDINDYDDETKKKIEAYKKWYDKAEACRKTIKELTEQQQELAKQKLDNIVEYYDHLNDRLDAVADNSAAVRDFMAATGKEIKAQDYSRDLDAMTRKADKLREERTAYANQLQNLMASGIVKYDSNEWHEYTAQLEEMDKALIDVNTSIADMRNEIAQIAVTNLKYALDVLTQTQTVIEAIMGFHDAQGTDNTASYYEDLVRNGFDQIKNLEAQNAELKKQQEGLDTLSERYQELQSEINSNEQSIWQMKTAQEQWNDAIADLKIDALQKERDELEKQNTALQKKLDMEQALEDLAKARQRKKLMFSENRGFYYAADEDAIRAAQDKVDELQHQETLDKIDEAIDAIKDNKKDDNVYDYSGTEQVKKFATGGVNVQTGLAQLDGTPNHAEVVFNAADASKLYNMVHDGFEPSAMVLDGIRRAMEAQQVDAFARNVTVQIGDINLSGVEDPNGLAKAIKQNLQAAMLQALYKN